MGTGAGCVAAGRCGSLFELVAPLPNEGAHHVPPVDSPTARRMRAQGVVILKAVIWNNRSGRGCESAQIRAAARRRRHHSRPAVAMYADIAERCAGAGGHTVTTVTVNFTLPQVRTRGGRTVEMAQLRGIARN